MSEGLKESFVSVDERTHRVWRKGHGRPLGYLAGVGGLPKWTPFLDELALTREVIAPSLPGCPGAAGHEHLDTIFDWILSTHDILAAAGLRGTDLMAASVAGALAAEVAAVWPEFVSRLVLVAPSGLFDVSEPPADLWAAQRARLHEPVCPPDETSKAFIETSAGADRKQCKVEQARALEASARPVFPGGNTGIAARLHRIRCPVLLLRGAQDRVVPASHIDRFAAAVSGRAVVREIAGAGHLAEIDQPLAVAKAVREFLE